MPRRVRRRYLALRVVSEEPVSLRDFKSIFWNALLQLFGEYGASKVGFSLIDYNQQSGQAIVRCSHKALEMVRASIASITEINEKPMAIHTMRVSGTLKALSKRVQS